MVFDASDSQYAGKLYKNKGLRNPYPVNNMNINNARYMGGRYRMRREKGKNKGYGKHNNTVRTMAVPNSNGPLHTLHPRLRTRFPIERSFMFDAPSADKAYYYGMIHRNRLKKRRILPKNKLYSTSLHAPLAPRNTTSFIMRAKKHGGIASAVTPSPATPALLSTPLLSPGMRDKGSMDEMNKELGVNGYGSMNGLIRLRSYRDTIEDAASEMKSDVEQGESTKEAGSIHSVELLEQRLDQGLSRFEMIYPSLSATTLGVEPGNIANYVNNQGWLISHLEEENLTLRERIFLVEQEVNELRQRVRAMEGSNSIEVHMKEQFEESCGDISVPFV